MKVKEDQAVRFVDMMYKFCNKYGIRFDYEWRGNDHDVCDMKFTRGPGWTVHSVYFSKVGSLSEAAAPVMADVMNYFDICKSGCSVEIKNVIFNPPATIVFWADGTKTVVKTQEDDEFDPEKGLAMAISKKALGNQGNYYNQFSKWTEKYEGPEYAGGVTVDEFIQNIRRVFGLKE